MATPLKVLFFDLETAPLLAFIWRPNDEYIPHDRLNHDSFLLCWSAKWAHEKRVLSGSLTSKEARKQDDERIVLELADLIKQADVIVAHNIKGFDLPMLNNRLLLNGLDPLPPVPVIDTYLAARKTFRLAYNKLDYLADILGFGKKIKTDFDLWRECYHGDEAAMTKMVFYNRRDVVLLEKVFNRLKAYIPLPSMVTGSTPGEMCCPYCGSVKFWKRGVKRYPVMVYQQFQCQACRKYFRAEKGLKNSLSTRIIAG
jgi:hypothetical protein